ncbi:MAG: TSUP family transporter, partial [Planctomycetota bacterium]
MELTLMVIVMILIISFLCEYMDATLGMGYGTTLTPLLLLLGFAPGIVVPAILVSQLISNTLASICHHREGNVNFRPNGRQVFEIRGLIHPAAYFKGVRQSFPIHLKVGLLFGGCGVIGAIVAVIVSV